MIGVGNANRKNSARRKFFQSEARWDVGVERASVRVVDVGRFMEAGGMEGVDELGFEGWDNGQEGEGAVLQGGSINFVCQ